MGVVCVAVRPVAVRLVPVGVASQVQQAAIGASRSLLQLQRRVGDAERGLQSGGGVDQEGVVRRSAGPHQMGGQRRLGRAQRLDMQVVHVRNPRPRA